MLEDVCVHHLCLSGEGVLVRALLTMTQRAIPRDGFRIPTRSLRWAFPLPPRAAHCRFAPCGSRYSSWRCSPC